MGIAKKWATMKQKNEALPNVKATPLALDTLVTYKAKIHLFDIKPRTSHVELEARHEIELEKYVKTRSDRSSYLWRTLVPSHILPPSFQISEYTYSKYHGIKEIGLKEPAFSNQKQILEKISEHISQISSEVSKMIEARKKSKRT